MRATGNMEKTAKVRYRRTLDQFSFDMGTDRTTSFQIRLYEAHIKGTNLLGSILGKGMVPKVRQLALMAGLIHSKHIGGEDQAELIAILRRFIVVLRLWASDLEKISNSVSRMAVRCSLLSVSNPWDEIVQP